MDTFETAMEQPEEKCFEDAFMEVLSDYVSLCLEATNGAVDVIYGFIYQSQGLNAFNVFFAKDGQILTNRQLLPKDLCRNLLRTGVADIPKLLDVCNKFGQKCPHEIKTIYHVHTKTFDAHFEYRDYSELDDISTTDVLMAWINEEKANLN